MATFHENLKQSFKNFKNKYIGNVPSGVTLAQINADLTAKSLVNTYYDSTANKLYQVNADGTKGSEIKMGMPNINYTTPLYNFANGTSYTATKTCYLLGTIAGAYPGETKVSINGKHIYWALGTSAGTNLIVPLTKLTSGDVVTINAATTSGLYIFEEK